MWCNYVTINNSDTQGTLMHMLADSQLYHNSYRSGE